MARRPETVERSPELNALPVAEALPRLASALRDGSSAVLVAPPGAGKTTLVPLALLDAEWRGDGTLVLLEPRRIAARAAARRMATLLGEEVGATVGYAMRLDRKVSERTRILVVTEGVLGRMVLDDPELPGIAAILFDEFHERSLDGDFALALALDAQAALRPDLKLVVMSATVDGAAVARLLDGAPVIESSGRSFPVELVNIDRPPMQPVEQAMAAAICEAMDGREGSLLAFLPGRREIERTADNLAGRLGADVDVIALHGDMDAGAQDEAIRPAKAGRRKIVLATSIAETSITIEDVRIVVDSGLSRVPKYEPATGLTRLETVRVSRASADQRAGRAGRTAPGVAIRLWRAEQTAALQPYSTPEIMEADLSGLVLDCASFGVGEPASLAFLDKPPAAALAEARALLRSLEALDEDGRITDTGRAMRRLALPARLAHMVARGADEGSARKAAEIAVLLTERGLGGRSTDLETRHGVFMRERGERAEQARQMARRLARQAGEDDRAGPAEAGVGELLFHAYPDRVAKARGMPGQFVLANGRGAGVDAADPLARETFLVVADLQGRAQNARVAAAAAITEEAVRRLAGSRIERRIMSAYDAEKGTVRTREVEWLGAIRLSERALPPSSGAEADAAIIEAVRENGLGILPWSKGAEALRARLGWLHHAVGEPWPAMDDAALIDRVEDWLLPYLRGSASLAGLDPSILSEALLSLVPYEDRRAVDRLAPSHFDAPSGSRLPVRYEEAGPVLAVRVQELFGLASHPAIAGGRVPLTLELLSPAHRPIQTTRDLPGFWRGSWADVRSDMRGRYPKHVWPEDPATAAPTARAKPRGQ